MCNAQDAALRKAFDHMSIEQPFFQTKAFGDVIVIRFTVAKLVDPDKFAESRDQLAKLVDEGNYQSLLFDFTHVEFLSSGCLNTLISIYTLAKAAGVRIAVCNVKSEVEEVFAITRLDKIFPSEPHPDADDPPECSGSTARLPPKPPFDEGSMALQPPPPDSHDY